jgi:hypothetical protein
VWWDLGETPTVVVTRGSSWLRKLNWLAMARAALGFYPQTCELALALGAPQSSPVWRRIRRSWRNAAMVCNSISTGAFKIVTDRGLFWDR